MNAILKLFKSDADENQYMSTLVDPFKKKSIETIAMCIRKDWQGNVQYQATIYFENGPTKGEHKINGLDFNSLVKQVDVFVKNLES